MIADPLAGSRLRVQIPLPAGAAQPEPVIQRTALPTWRLPLTRKGIGLVAAGLTALATGGYWFASPYLALRSIEAAVVGRDGDRLNRMIDYPKLRETIKTDVVAVIRDAMAQQPDLKPEERTTAMAMSAAFLAPIANTVIDSVLTPDMVKGVIEGTLPPPNATEPDPTNPFQIDTTELQNEIEELLSNNPETLQQGADLHLAYEGGLNMFRATITRQGISVGIILERRGFAHWQITDVDLPPFQQLEALQQSL